MQDIPNKDILDRYIDKNIYQFDEQDREDIIQDLYLNILENKDSYSKYMNDRLSRYFKTVFKHYKKIELIDYDCLNFSYTVDDYIVDKVMYSDILKFLDCIIIDEYHKELFLKFYNGYSVRELSEIYNMSDSRIYQIINEIIEKLKVKALKSHYDVPVKKSISNSRPRRNILSEPKYKIVKPKVKHEPIEIMIKGEHCKFWLSWGYHKKGSVYIRVHKFENYKDNVLVTNGICTKYENTVCLDVTNYSFFVDIIEKYNLGREVYRFSASWGIDYIMYAIKLRKLSLHSLYND